MHTHPSKIHVPFHQTTSETVLKFLSSMLDVTLHFTISLVSVYLICDPELHSGMSSKFNCCGLLLYTVMIITGTNQ